MSEILYSLQQEIDKLKNKIERLEANVPENVAKTIPRYIMLSVPYMISSTLAVAQTNPYAPDAGVPSGARIVSVFSSGYWTAASSTYSFGVYAYNGTQAFARYNSKVANIHNNLSANVPLTNNYFTVRIYGAAMASQFLYITGYWL